MLWAISLDSASQVDHIDEHSETDRLIAFLRTRLAYSAANPRGFTLWPRCA